MHNLTNIHTMVIKSRISMQESNEISWRTSREDNVHETELQTGENIEVHLIETVCYSVVWTGSI